MPRCFPCKRFWEDRFEEMDYLVVGGAGMLGHKVLQNLLESGLDCGCTLHGYVHDPSHERVALFRSVPTVLEGFDALAIEAAVESISRHRPKVIINCLGVIKQRDDATRPIPSILLNSLWPHRLAEAAREWEGRVIHFSTDCVFAGTKGRYREDDEADANDLYGRTKLLGELTESNSLTLRTSIIGRELAHFASLLEWFLSNRGGRVRGFARVWYSGVTTNYLASLVRKLMFECPTLTGVYHVAGPRISKYDLLCQIRAAFGLDIEITADDTVVSDRSLNGERFEQATQVKTLPWHEMLTQLATDTTPYTQWQSPRN